MLDTNGHPSTLPNGIDGIPVNEPAVLVVLSSPCGGRDHVLCAADTRIFDRRDGTGHRVAPHDIVAALRTLADRIAADPDNL